MHENQLLVVVIETPKSSRSKALLDSLQSDTRFKVDCIPAYMLNSYSDIINNEIVFDVGLFEYIQGRKMYPQELGCAVSHNQARSLIASSSNGGVILEDDARILDLDSFYRLSVTFLREHKFTSSILSLTGYRNLGLLNSNIVKIPSRNIVSLFGKPDLAVGYAITPFAGRDLIGANTPISTVSDWPETKSHYSALLCPVVKHGDFSTGSVILMDRADLRMQSHFFHKMKMFFSPKHIMFVSSKIGLRGYIEKVYLERIFWRLDTYVFKLRLLRYKVFHK